MKRLIFKPEERVVEFKFFYHFLFGDIPYRQKYIHHVDINGNNNPSVCNSTWNKHCPICAKARVLWNENVNTARKYMRHHKELYCVEIISDSKNEFEKGERVFVQFSRLNLLNKYIEYTTYFNINDIFDGSIKIVSHKKNIRKHLFVEHRQDSKFIFNKKNISKHLFVEYRQDSKFIFNKKEYPLEMPDGFMEPTIEQRLKTLFRANCNKSGFIGIRKFIKIVKSIIEERE